MIVTSGNMKHPHETRSEVVFTYSASPVFLLCHFTVLFWWFLDIGDIRRRPNENLSLDESKRVDAERRRKKKVGVSLVVVGFVCFVLIALFLVGCEVMIDWMLKTFDGVCIFLLLMLFCFVLSFDF